MHVSKDGDHQSCCRKKRQAWIALGLWLAFTFSAAATGVFVATDGWYEALAKPAWNPPNWIFGPVWTALYAMMAVAAWLVWRQGGWHRQRWALILFVVQWTLNALWTPLFFGLQRSDIAFACIVLLLLAILLTLMAFGRVRRLAALLLVPYAVWVGFAAFLNLAIWRLNADLSKTASPVPTGLDVRSNGPMEEVHVHSSTPVGYPDGASDRFEAGDMEIDLQL